MAAPYNPPVKGEDFIFAVGLEDANNLGSFKASPTLAAGDVKVSKDGGAYANINTLPTVTPTGGTDVEVTLSATEMTADRVTVTFIDQSSPKEWADFKICILTTT